MKKKYILLCIFALLTAISTAFIFFNSSQDGETSLKRSNVIVDKAVELIEKDSGESRSEDERQSLFYDVEVFVRKSAHVIEFAFLGLFAGLLSLSIGSVTGRLNIFFPLFYTLAAAVADEFIQNYTGRTSKVLDVLYDFAGALGSIIVVFAVYSAVKLIKKKKIGQ